MIQETAYPLIELNKLRDFRFNRQKGRITNFEWSDGLKDYKFTFGKYKEQLIIEVAKDHRDYLEWMKGNMDMREPLRTFVNELLK